MKLTTSITKINERTKPNKKKQSTKLKLILADPQKNQMCIPTISPHKINEFSSIINVEISKAILPGREFANRFGISLGMASFLRAISNSTAVYVLISKSIKPKFIIQQIAYFARQRQSGALVYLAKELEELTKKLFGIASTVMTITKTTSEKIAEWVEGQTLAKEKKALLPKPYTPKSVDDTTKSRPFTKFNLNSALLKKDRTGERVFVPSNAIRYDHEVIDNRIKSTGDYMSFAHPNTSLPRRNIGASDAERKKQRNNNFRKIPNTAQDNKVQSKREFTSTGLPKIVYEVYDKDFDFPRSYAKLKTLAILPNKNKVNQSGKIKKLDNASKKSAVTAQKR